MEFPEDVLKIIREYSRPLMRFSGEYRTILIELRMKDWPEVRLKLCTSDAERVIESLIAYKNAYLETASKMKNMFRRYPRILSSHPVDYYKSIIIRNNLFRNLQIVLHGEDKILEQERRTLLDLNEQN